MEIGLEFIRFLGGVVGLEMQSEWKKSDHLEFEGRKRVEIVGEYSMKVE